MPKIIRSHKECGHRLMGLCLYDSYNGHLLSDKKYCLPAKEQNFPDNCPLEDAEVKPEFNG